MSNKLLTSVLSIKTMPIRAVQFYQGAEYLLIYNIEKETTWTLEPITMNHYKGGEIQVGFKIAASIYVPQNQYAETNSILQKLERYRIIQDTDDRPEITFALGNESFSAVVGGNEPGVYNSTGDLKLYLGKQSVKYKIEQADYRPRIIIEISGYLKELTYGTGSNYNFQ